MSKYTAIILAAGMGSRLRPLTDNVPKCMVELAGKPLLHWQLEVMRKNGIVDVVVVVGYKEEMVVGDRIRKVYNKDFASTNMLASLFCAQEYIQGDVIISYADIVYSDNVLQSVMENRQDIVIASDEDWLEYWKLRFEDPLVDAETFRKGERQNVVSLGQKAESLEFVEGQYIGLIKLSKEGSRKIREEYYECVTEKSCVEDAWGSGRSLSNAYMTDFLHYFAQKGVLYYQPIRRGWFEIDSVRDLKIAEKNYQIVE